MFSMSAPIGSSSRDRPVTVVEGISRRWRLRNGSIPGLTQLSRRFRSPIEVEEERAMARGWRVERARWGGRTYRDPRFDALAGTVDMGQCVGHDMDTAAVVPVVAR